MINVDVDLDRLLDLIGIRSFTVGNIRFSLMDCDETSCDLSVSHIKTHEGFCFSSKKLARLAEKWFDVNKGK
jgi:hypothetical protein